jgi:methyltransferase (TIGR00027 family)
VVFEVDHPDSQRDKRARITTLTQTAREVRFVPVDFARDDLGAALASAGHDPALPTTWIWEGVVMYLRPEEVDATLAAIASRSAAGSRAVVLYHGPALVLHAVGLALRAIGEPLRSTFTPAAMRALLTKHGFTVARDENLPELARTLSPDLAGAARPVAHMRLATADR